MNRLTGRMGNDNPYYPHCYESNCDGNCAACDFDYEVSEKLASYEDLEEKLEEVYGECEGLLETVISHLVQHEDVEIGKPKKARLLTDEDVDKWEDLKNAEEQGLLIKLPCKIDDIVFVVGSKCLAEVVPHEECMKNDCDYCIYGKEMIVFELKVEIWLLVHLVLNDCENWMLNKTVFLTKEEAEQALARMEG